MMSTDSELEKQDVIEDLILDKVVNRLTDFVRKQYCNYLENLLKKNYQNWCFQTIGTVEFPPSEWIKTCVNIYEEEAIKSCMIVQFYRQTMLKIMAKIRKSTINGKLDCKIKNYNGHIKLEEKSIKNHCTVSTQTEEIIQDNLIDTTFPSKRNSISSSIDTFENIEENHRLSLDERLVLFRKRFIDSNENKKKRPSFGPDKKRFHYSDSSNKKTNMNYKKTKTEISEHSEEVKKIQNQNMRIESNETIENLFTITHNQNIPEQITKNSIEENLESNFCDIEKQLEEIFEPKPDDIAIELDKLFKEEEDEIDELFGSLNEVEDPKINEILHEIETSNLPKIESISFPKLEPEIKENNELNEVQTLPNQSTWENQFEKSSSKVSEYDEILKNSLWPCELHMRRKKLQDLLFKISDEFGMRCHENLRIKFLLLFGEDEEDEFAPFSPTIELDSVLLSSCKKRIAPWIVKYLMVPMNHGRIGDRIVFKKFAKLISHKIIIEDQYPSESYVKNAIEDYFMVHKSVMALEDIRIC